MHSSCFVGLEQPARISATDYGGCAGSLNGLPKSALGICTSATCGSKSTDGYPAFRLTPADHEQAWQRSRVYPILLPGVNDSTRTDGVIGILGRVKESDVSDGASMTFLAGERRMSPELYEDGRSCENDQGWTVGFDWDNVRWMQDAPQPDFTIAPGVDPSCQGLFGSAHVTSFGMVMSDGAVRTFSYDVNPTVFRFLGSRNGDDLVGNY